MVRVGTNRRKMAGTSLIEVLVVIVVFLVGILAVVQIFPPGLAILRLNRAQTLATALARGEVQRVLGQSAQLPERIVAGSFDASGTVFILSQTDPSNFNPPVTNPGNLGEIDSNGNVLISGTPIGKWQQQTGSNKINRIIGEGRPISQPTVVNGIAGSRMQLMFAPIYYINDGVQGQSLGQVLSVYGNDLRRALGSSDDVIPDSTAALYDTDSFYYVPADKATNVANTPAGFDREDQIWIGLLQDAGTGLPVFHDYRISMSFVYNDGVTDRVVEAIFTAQSNGVMPYYRQFNNQAVFSIPELVAASGFAPAGYRGVEISSIRVQRIFREVPGATPFNQYDPYQFKCWNHALGMLLLNPAGATEKVRDLDGNAAPLIARADYSVYDWRIMRDEFSVPTPVLAASFNPNIKLLVNSVRAGSGTGPDNRPYGGIALAGDGFMQTPDLTGTLGSQDFVMVDLETGGIVVGNSNAATSAYFVDKSNGNVQFKDTDNSDGFAITGRMYIPDGTYQGWTLSAPMELAGRRMRSLYTANGDFATQVLKASASYSIVFPSAPNQLVAGQCYEGGSNGWGQTNRLYFPLIDSRQKVSVGEMWVAGAGAPVIRDRDLKISGIEQIGGVTVAYAELPNGATFDASRNNYAVRRVNGASIKVRAFYNPDTWQLGSDPATNFDRLRKWTERYYTTTTETFDAGGNN
jgi:type II secretory pathway pseudopilin PulG